MDPSATCTSSSSEIIDSNPLLHPQAPAAGPSVRHPSPRPALRGVARFVRQRAMRETSMLVREAAAGHLEERRSEWAYSRPVVVLDLVWNLVFVSVSVAVLVTSGRGRSESMPLRLWIVGYALQCALHMVCVCIEYKRRRALRGSVYEQQMNGNSGAGEGGGYGTGDNEDEEGMSTAKHLESANTMFSFIWWIIGFYWVSAVGQTLIHHAPHLYWLCIVFLAFDVLFVVFCVALACIIGIAICCCLPCIIAILYAIVDQEGASEEEIRLLPKCKFRILNFENFRSDPSEPFGGIMAECSNEAAFGQVLSAEDAECCICLSSYEDGVELRELPCGHHFHCTCIDKWLYINATCPLCKYNITKTADHRREYV